MKSVHRMAAFALPFAVAVVASAWAQAPRFAPAGFLPARTATRILSGDFDGDGRVDLATVNAPVGMSTQTLPSELELWRGDGFGGFERAQSQALNGNATALASADLDADGRPELLIAQKDIAIPNWVAYELQANGTFAFVASAPAGAGVADVTSADVDGDGDRDVVAANPDAKTLTISRQSGGVFTTPTTIALGFTGSQVCCADFDGDGNVDYAVAGYNSIRNIVRIARGDGAGGISSATDVFMNGTFLNAFELLAGDVDADGDLDLAFCGFGAEIVENLGSAFAAAVAVDSAPIARPTGAFADMDGDGDLDLVLSTNTDTPIQLATNDGTGSFGTPQPLQPKEMASPSIAVADLNGDGMLDLARTESFAVRIALAQAPAVLAAAPASATSGAVFVSAAHGDIDGDGDRDAMRFALGSNEFVQFTNDGGGHLVQAVAIGASGPVYVSALRDLDGDALPELISITYPQQAVSVRANLGGSFGPEQLVLVPANLGAPDRFAFSDLDADGDVDMVVVSKPVNGGFTVFRNDSGVFVAVQSVFAYLDTTDLELGDITNDGIPDLVVVLGGSQNTLQYFPGTGGAQFSGSPLDIGTTISFIRSFELGDLDGDGRLDLAYIAASGASQPDQLGSFVFTTGMNSIATHRSIQAGGADLRLVDLDGDGRLDALRAAGPGRALAWSFGNGDGSFGSDTAVAVSGQADGFDVANYDADPELEFVCGRFGSTAQITLHQVCVGAAAAYGHGCVGSGGYTPRMTQSGCASASQTVLWTIDRALGGSVAVVLLGANPVQDNFGTGCTLQLAPLFPGSFVVPLGGTGAGNGNLIAPITLPANFPAAFGYCFQSACADPAMPWGFTVTNPVQVVTD